jgi:hypothetical protein
VQEGRTEAVVGIPNECALPSVPPSQPTLIQDCTIAVVWFRDTNICEMYMSLIRLVLWSSRTAEGSLMRIHPRRSQVFEV